MVFQIYGLNISLYENTKLPKWSPNNSCVPFFSYGAYCYFVCLSVFSKRMWFYQSRHLVCLVHHWFHMKGFHQMFRNYWWWGWGLSVCPASGLSRKPGRLPEEWSKPPWIQVPERMRCRLHKSSEVIYKLPFDAGIWVRELASFPGSWLLSTPPPPPPPPRTPHSTKGANSHLLQYRKPSEQQPRPLLPLPSFLLQRCLDVKNSTRCVSDTTLSTLHELILHSSEVVLLTLF